MGGVTRRASEEQVERSGLKSELLARYDRPIPEGAEHVWEWFWQLNRGRTCGMASFNPIGWQEIAAWSQLTGNRPRQWELDALSGIDTAFLAAHAPDPPKEKKK